MKQILSLIMSIVVMMVVFNNATVAAAANTTESGNTLIKEGRIWTYFSDINCKMDPCEDIFLNVGFKGITNIDGVEYHNCVVWKAGDESSDDYATIAYMREENGRVYVRYIPDLYRKVTANGIDLMANGPTVGYCFNDWDTLGDTEILLFDSNLEEGDVLVSNEEDANSKRYDVTNCTEVECLGINRRKWNYTIDPRYEICYEYYEGIGDLIGLLPFPNSLSFIYGANPWMLIDVKDEAGDVIFDSKRINATTVSPLGDSTPIDAYYHDIDGKVLNGIPSAGVYLKTTRYDNGTTRTEKMIAR